METERVKMGAKRVEVFWKSDKTKGSVDQDEMVVLGREVHSEVVNESGRTN